MPIYPVDPMTPGVGATKSAKRLPLDKVPTIMKIPSAYRAGSDDGVEGRSADHVSLRTGPPRELTSRGNVEKSIELRGYDLGPLAIGSFSPQT